jgi:IclR family pca regulon transcriptional regulator
VPAYCTANGRVLLAALPNGALSAFLARQVMLPLTPQTITQPERLRLEIERVRVRGYALVDQELEPGLRTLSVPLRNYRGEVLAAINVSVHAGRMPSQELLERCLPMLLEVQAHLRQQL